ncbi:CDP-diacylglycerol--serine O-phosphatidyltransferase [Pseudalkalibacillus salsuginis]|uniref:CDP-diacylglycerol--serine O-phosphatidyltransferase n=1 Tax=Pseudalkalibacillus salsuginis TaxID=2910972 RepID=UPI001F2800FC|nr:CDP-diacylglycerol--serine O-phosphatidyltransferase [Pseudalkalibacillus salsuginis]MCF6408573.1 CDP-diacylglycerol--serine O-phosphatidyltransferase [Pseudalkalibacillus salsuginis]
MYFLDRVDHTLKRMKSQTANAMTLLNMTFGAVAIVCVLKGQLEMSFWFIFLCALFDRFDGMIARKLQIESEFGKQLDSLCDLISFGVAPAFLIYQAILHDFGTPGIVFIIIYMLCGAIRLARFNITEFDGHFRGVPITAAGCIVALSFLTVDMMPNFIFMFLILILSFLMISNVSVKKR